MKCETCKTKLPHQSAGRPRKFCSSECRVLNDAIVRMEKALGPVNARLMAGTNDDRMGLVDLRYRLFTVISDEVTRPRYPAGLRQWAVPVGQEGPAGPSLGGRFIKRRV